jgi:hypothetical protein
MKDKEKKDALAIVNDIVLIGSAIVAIGVSLLDFLGVLDQIPWLVGRVPIITLLSLSFLLASAVIERRTRIDKIQETLDSIISSYTFGTQYLDDADTVISQLERITRRANESIMALGAKSRAKNYLSAIQEAVLQRRVIHYRLLDGDYIPHELHEHLKEIVHAPNVQIAWTPREKFGNLLVTENESVMAFPAPYLDKFSGLWLPGQTNSRRYTQYFLEAFSKSLPVRTEKAIEVLCIQCSPATAGKLAGIKRVIEEEFKLASETGIKADLL